jgi:hypothetical protein
VDTDVAKTIGQFFECQSEVDITKPLMRGSMAQIDEKGTMS